MDSLPEPPALNGKVIVVVGGTSGIGWAATRAFCQAGARVVALGLDDACAREAEVHIGATGRVVCGDARQPETAAKAIEEALRVFGGFHGLFHVAGGSGRKWGDGPLHELTDEGWIQTLDLNLTSVMYSNRAAVRHFLQQQSPGAVLNVGSVLADSPSPAFFSTHAYVAAKAAIAGFTRSCAAFYAPQGIRFNVLSPGLVATPMSRRAQTDPRIAAFIRSKQPLDSGRIGAPEDLTAAAVFFLSDAARFVTGQELAVDGGWSVSEGQVPPP